MIFANLMMNPYSIEFVFFLVSGIIQKSCVRFEIGFTSKRLFHKSEIGDFDIQLIVINLQRNKGVLSKRLKLALVSMFLVSILTGTIVALQSSLTENPPSIQENGQQSEKLSTKHGLLSEEFQRDRKCGTPMLLEVRENCKSLTLETGSKLGIFFGRPTNPGGDFPDYTQHLLPQLYNTTNFVLHWTNGTDGGNVTDAVPLDDTDSSGFPDYVEDFADIFEEVWNFEINFTGFHAPPSDEKRSNDEYNGNPDGRYDVFIFNMIYYGLCYPEGQANSSSSYYSYIGVENDYQGFSTPQLGAMQVTAAHEFFHAIQFYYDVWEDMWWMETAAVYMEDEVYPNVNDNYQYFRDWFPFPDTRGLESTRGLHEYGNFIFAKFLSENFEDEIIKEIWEKMSEPDMDGLTAINATLIDKNSAFFEVFNDFITANFFLEEMYEDGVEYREALTGISYGGVRIEYQYDAFTAQNNTEINDDLGVSWKIFDKWGTDYITMELDPEKPKYRIFFDGLNNTINYLVKLVAKKDGNISETRFQLNASKDGYIHLFYDDFDNVTLMMANTGNIAIDDLSWRVIITYFQPPSPSLYVEPSIIYEPIHKHFAINVSIADVFDLWEFELKLHWDTTVLDCANATPTLLWSSALVSSEMNETEGYYWLAAQGQEPSSPFNGNATLATITLYCAEIGESPLELMDTLLIEYTTGEPIFHQLQEGYFNALSHDIALRNITVSDTMVEQGDSLLISVTAENQGDFMETFNVTVYANTTAIGEQEISLNAGESSILIFTWNTTDFDIGNYIIKSVADIVPEETDMEDNTFTDGVITISVYVSDIAVLNVTLSKTIVCQDYSVNISVTVENQGDAMEIFDIKIYVSETEIETRQITLESGNIENVTFTWNTTGFDKGNYTISAYAHPVPGETDIIDNTYKDGWIVVAMVGDLTGPDGWPDGKVDIRDVAVVAKLFGIDHPDHRYNPNYDIIYDLKIDIKDVATVAIHYGEIDS